MRSVNESSMRSRNIKGLLRRDSPHFREMSARFGDTRRLTAEAPHAVRRCRDEDDGDYVTYGAFVRGRGADCRCNHGQLVVSRMIVEYSDGPNLLLETKNDRNL